MSLVRLCTFLFWDAAQSLYRGTASVPELFTGGYWRYRKAARILLQARYRLSRRNVVGSDWEALGILIEAYWRVEDDYYGNKKA
jgi:hypothetical protein